MKPKKIIHGSVIIPANILWSDIVCIFATPIKHIDDQTRFSIF
jgi:hypothetical protein